jgi:Trypsin
MQSSWQQTNVNGVVSGWGATDPLKGENSMFLQFLTQRTRACAVGGGILLPPSPIPNENLNICTEILAGNNGGICVRDEGGPLRSSVTSQLIGIASRHGFPCAAQADVFVRISAYRTWIGSVTGV